MLSLLLTCNDGTKKEQSVRASTTLADLTDIYRDLYGIEIISAEILAYYP